MRKIRMVATMGAEVIDEIEEFVDMRAIQQYRHVQRIGLGIWYLFIGKK